MVQNIQTCFNCCYKKEKTNIHSERLYMSSIDKTDSITSCHSDLSLSSLSHVSGSLF